MIRREQNSQRSKTDDLKSEPRANFAQAKSPQGSGRKDWHSRCRCHARKKTKSIEIINRINFISNHQIFNRTIIRIIELILLTFVCEWRATQNSTRGVLFGPIQGYSLGNQPEIISKPPANKFSLRQKRQQKSNFCTRLCSGVTHPKSHPKLRPTSTKRPQKNTARKQEWRESYSEQTLDKISDKTTLYTRIQIPARIARRFKIWMKNGISHRNIHSMQISGQKSQLRTFPTAVQEFLD